MKIRKQIPSVVSTVQDQTAQAENLARIPGQDRLTDPRTNPAVRPHADRLRDVQHRLALDAEHGRIRRRHRVEDQRASHAEKSLEALQEAKEASSPARSVLALHASRARYMRVSLATSIVLAFGSARGLEQIASEYKNIPAGSGYIAEVGLTGLATIVILAKSDLAQHGGKTKGWQNNALWLLMVGPLLASMAANIHGGNVIGAICAAGAAAFSLFSYIVADAFAVSARAQAKNVTGDDEADLRKIAVGDDLFSARTEEVHQGEVQAVPVPEVQAQPEVRELAAPEVHEPEVVRNPTPEPANPNQSEPVEPKPVHHAPEVREPSEPELLNPEVRNREVQEPADDSRSEQEALRTKTAPSLGDRAQRKAAEVQQVRELIEDLGYDAVTLNVVRDRFKFTKTTAYNRLIEARNLVNQAAAS